MFEVAFALRRRVLHPGLLFLLNSSELVLVVINLPLEVARRTNLWLTFWLTCVVSLLILRLLKGVS